MMQTALTIVKLRWSLTWATLRKSVWQTIGYVFSMLLGFGAVVTVGMLAWFLGAQTYGPGPRSVFGMNVSVWLAILQTVVVIGGSFLTLVVAFVQLMLIGEGSTMSPRRFELYGIPDRRLQSGLLLAGLSGIPAITGLLALLLWSMAYRPLGAGMVIAAVVAAPLAIVTMISLSKMLISLSTTLVRSQRGKNLFYIVAIVLFILVCQIPNLVINTGSVQRYDPLTFLDVAKVFGWTPLGAAFQLPFDVLDGFWWQALLKVLVLVATWVVCFMLSTWCLRRERLTTGSDTTTVVAKGVGAFAWVSDSRSGGISARLITYLKRDPRQTVMLLMPIIFVVLFSLQSRGISVVAWQALLWSGWFINISESNGLAYDGRGFTMQVLSAVPGRDDRIGRVKVFAVIELVYLLVMAVALFIITGDWRSGQGIATGVVFTAMGIAMALVGLGLAEVLSCSLMYPVASLEKPFSSPQGRAMAQGFVPMVYMLGAIVLMLPTAIPAIVFLVSDQFVQQMWLIAAIALVNGVAALVVGTVLGGKLMDRRLLKIVGTLDSFASLQK